MFDPDPAGYLDLPSVVAWVAEMGAKGGLPRRLGFVHPGDVADALDLSAAQTARMVVREHLISGTLPFELIVYPSGHRMPAPGLAHYFSSEHAATTMETGWLDLTAIGLDKDLHQARVIIAIDKVAAALGFRLIRPVDTTPPDAPAPSSAEADAVAKRDAWAAQVERHHGTVKALKAWATARYGHNLPGRNVLLKHHRVEFGKIRGINQTTMAPVRQALASRESKLGGAPTHQI